MLIDGPVAAAAGYLIGKAVEKGIESSPEAQKDITKVVHQTGLAAISAMSSDTLERNNAEAEAKHKPNPNTTYKVDNIHSYTTDELGRVKEVSTTLESGALLSDRNSYQQCKAGKCGLARAFHDGRNHGGIPLEQLV